MALVSLERQARHVIADGGRQIDGLAAVFELGAGGVADRHTHWRHHQQAALAIGLSQP